MTHPPMRYHQVLVYGVPVPEVEAGNEAWEAFNRLTSEGAIVQTEANQHTVIVGVLLTDPREKITAKVDRLVSENDKFIWNAFADDAEQLLGVALLEPRIWFCILEVADKDSDPQELL